MTHNNKYKAFISYSHVDQEWGRWLHRALENYRTPKHLMANNPADGPLPTRLTPIFRDREELASSPDLSERINAALTNSESLIVVCSPNSRKSQWVDQEIEAFKRLGRSKKIYCLIVAGDPGNPGAADDCFPPTLRIKYDDEGQRIEGAAEPIAADAREQGDGKKLAKLKLIAGLLDVGLDVLSQRELQRRNRRLLAVTVSSLLATAFTIALAVNATVARNDAEMARIDADQRREQAENLISFMLGDLRDQLQPVGRLDVLDGVGQQALEYFSSLNASDMTNDTLLIRATALRQIGEVRVAQGLITEGLVAFNQAEGLLANSSTENEGVRLFELGQINYWIADAYFQDLQLEEAQTYIERYLAISRELILLEPNNPDYQLELLYAESNLGTLAYRSNELDTARTYFTNALSVGRDITAENPTDENNLEIAVSLSWLGAVEATAGNFSLSLDWYQQQLDLRRNLMITSDAPNRKHMVGRALFLIAGIQGQIGQAAAAHSALDESVSLYRELVAYDPQNYEWQEELAWSLTSLASNSYAASNSTADATRATLLLANEAISSVGEENTAEVIRVFAAIDLELATVELIEGDPVIASSLARNAAERMELLISVNDRIRVLPLYARASYIAAEAARASEDETQSTMLAENALTNIELRSNDPIEVKAYAALLSYMAADTNADSLLMEVAETEYRAEIYIPNTETERWWSQRID